jgi:PAS domain-containing protein
MEGTQALLALDSPRVVVLHKGDRALTYRLRRVTQDDWSKYFAGIVHQTVNRGAEREEIYENESSLLALVTSVIATVEGYGDLSKLKDWKSALPMAHRMAVANILRSVGLSDRPQSDDEPLSELIEISLDAAWTCGDDGKVTMYNGLIHRFRQPSIEQLKRFNSEAARVRVSGTAENGVTTYPVRQAIAMRLYDELIESIDGYSIGGIELHDVEAIRREMDGLHKAHAVLGIFSRERDVAIL